MSTRWTDDHQVAPTTTRESVMLILSAAFIVWVAAMGVMFSQGASVPDDIVYDHDCSDGAYVKEAACAP